MAHCSIRIGMERNSDNVQSGFIVMAKGWLFHDSIPKENRDISDNHTYLIRMGSFQPTSRLHPALMGWFQPNPSYMG